jgi:hypothetical protein
MEELGRQEAAPEMVAALRRGWRLGAVDFLERLAEKLGRRGKAYALASQRGETDRERAERIVREGLEALNSDLSKTCFWVGRQSQLEGPAYRPDATAADVPSRLA